MINIDWKNAAASERLLWDHASALIAYTTITPLVYIGVTAGSEFLTYAATKLYIALELECSANNGASPRATEARINFYNEANVASFIFNSNDMEYDPVATQMRWQAWPCSIRNVYFGRLLASGYEYMKFIGYRLNIV